MGIMNLHRMKGATPQYHSAVREQARGQVYVLDVGPALFGLIDDQTQYGREMETCVIVYRSLQSTYTLHTVGKRTKQAAMQPREGRALTRRKVAWSPSSLGDSSPGRGRE
jgi:hypothetical protein